MLLGEKTGVNVDLPPDDGAILDEVPLPDWGVGATNEVCLLYTSPSPRDRQKSRMPSSA